MIWKQRRGRAVRNRESELAACHRIIDTHVAALIEKLDTENGRRY